MPADLSTIPSLRKRTRLHKHSRAGSFGTSPNIHTMIRNKILVASLFGLGLLATAGELRSQTPKPEPSPSADGQTRRGEGSVRPDNRDRDRLARFEKQTEELQALLKIPGMSAAIVKDGAVVWAKGLGFADYEKRIPATPDTLFHCASVTKTFASELTMQLVEQGKLDLEEPASRYSSDFKDNSVRIKHLLSHTSGDDKTPPGERYAYNPDRYEYLTAIIEKKTGKPLRQVFAEVVLDPLGMSGSIPGHSIVDESDKWSPLLGKERIDRYAKNLSRFAQPYTYYNGEIIHCAYPVRDFFGASAGLLSTVLDLAKYDAAIDRHVLLKKETQEKAWTPFVSNTGQRLMCGLGWFVTDYHGTRLVWHCGDWGTGFSAIFLKVPEKNISLIMLGNSEAVSDHQYKVGEDITNNVFASVFLRIFVSEDAHKRALPDPHWTQNTQEFSREIGRLSKESDGYGYDCERTSQTAMAKWLDRRRAQARKQVKVDPRIYDAYVGHYQRPTRALVVSKEGDRLFIDYPKDFKAELFPESEAKFFFKTEDLQLEFIKNAQGKVSGIEFHYDGQTEPLSAPRID
jgi:CubicO group peptidase (beta-lactamase class C family)